MTPFPTNIKILIADQQRAFRQSLRGTLELDSRVETVGEASDVPGTLDMLGRQNPDVLLLDLMLLRGSRFEEMLASHEELRSVRTLVMAAAIEKASVVEAFRFGAHGIVSKSAGRAVWRRSLRTVAAGRYWVGDESLTVLVKAFREYLCAAPPISAQKFGLTPRELEIVGKIADGHSNRDVGEAFSICERTVKHHLTNIFSKVGVSSRLELAVFARDQHVVRARPPRQIELSKAQKA